MAVSNYSFGGEESRNKNLTKKLSLISWPMVLLLIFLVAIGCVGLYSAADGSWNPWASRHIIRFAVCLTLAISIALIDIRVWFRFSYMAFWGTIGLLLLVEFFGHVGMGAQRWLDLKVIQLQPSELAKITMVMALARYYHSRSLEEVARLSNLFFPVLMILLTVGLVAIQPDLGTAIILLALGGVMMFLGGVQFRIFASVGIVGLAAIPIIWRGMEEYQKQRVRTFLNPESDPLGAGWNIIQSKIALGSGGLAGKGFLHGTQSHLDFLPEAHTDFIFTLLAEEWGLIGSMGIVMVFFVLTIYGFGIGLASRNHYGRMLALGLATNLFFYVFINIAMVMGLLPVVGVPLPLVSYGGTAMLTVMIGFGLLLSVLVHRDDKLPRRPDSFL